MLYAMDSFMFPEIMQTWCAAMRDQTAVQMIASATLQHQMQSQLVHAVEASAELLEEEMELPYQLATQSTRQPAPRRARRANVEARHH